MATTASPGPTAADRWPAAVGPVATAVLAAGGLAAIAAYNPFRAGAGPACPFHAVTGLYCPFCGATRGVYAALHGHPGLMAADNLLLPVLALAAVWGWAAWVSRLGFLPTPITGPIATKWARTGLLVLVVLFWVARNLPGLGILAPHGHL